MHSCPTIGTFFVWLKIKTIKSSDWNIRVWLAHVLISWPTNFANIIMPLFSIV